MRIVCICLNPAIDISSETDVIHPISKIRTHTERIEPGGGGVNVARVLCGLNTAASLIYLSGGSTGKLLDEELSSFPIDTHCFRLSSITRVAFNVHQTSNHQEYRFVPEGPVVDTGVMADVIDHIADLGLSADDLVVASGSLPRGVPDTTYASIAEVVERSQARFILDTSGAALSATLKSKARIFLVKPSLNELQKLADCKLDEYSAREFAESLVSDGQAEHVAVSMGSHGAFLASANSLIRLPAHLVKVQSAVGAGDSFVGALAHSLCKGHSVTTAFRYGVAAGAAAVMTPGSQLCHQADIERLFQSEMAFEDF